MDVRPADPRDAAPIARVHVGSWQAAYRGLLPDDFLAGLDVASRTRRWERALAEPDGPRTGVLVADDAGELVGFAHYCPSRDPGADPALVGEVSAIYLLPGSWRRGAGRQLMTAAMAALAAVGHREATLWVLDSNDRARRFYEAVGWSADGAVKQEAGPGFTLTEVRYRRPLP